MWAYWSRWSKCRYSRTYSLRVRDCRVAALLAM